MIRLCSLVEVHESYCGNVRVVHRQDEVHIVW